MNGDAKPDIRELSLTQLSDFFGSIEESHTGPGRCTTGSGKGAREFAALTSLPAGIRDRLAERYSFPSAGTEDAAGEQRRYG
ncbi:MAG: hypothetical protein MZV63_06345 [Marinilabiliales bacterium]|nr:hypothetical protein [Marinilabiliales bacterium]